MPSILDLSSGTNPAANQAVDTITSILQQHAQPSLSDTAQAATQNFVGQINPNDLKAPGSVTPQGQANTNAAEELKTPVAMIDILKQAADTGNAQSKAVLDTFGQFAPDPGDLGKLVQAAHDDPQQITPQNAASWAAAKAAELKLGSVKKATSDATLANIQAQTAERLSKAGKSTGGATSADELPFVGAGGQITAPSGNKTVASLLSPTAGSITPLSPMGPSTSSNTQIVTKYQGSTAPSGQMFVKNTDGSVGLAPIPGAGNKSSSPKPITAAQAGQLAMVKQGQDAIPEIKRLMFNAGALDASGNPKKGAQLDRTTLAQLTAIPFTNARPGIVSPKARQLWTAIYNMTDSKLRLESGAAVPETEVARTAQAYIANLIDTPETAVYKLKAPEKYFNDYMSLVGSTPGSVNNKPAATPQVAQSYKDKYGLQ